MPLRLRLSLSCTHSQGLQALPCTASASANPAPAASSRRQKISFLVGLSFKSGDQWSSHDQVRRSILAAENVCSRCSIIYLSPNHCSIYVPPCDTVRQEEKLYLFGLLLLTFRSSGSPYTNAKNTVSSANLH